MDSKAYIGYSALKDCYLGNNKVKEIWVGYTKVYPIQIIYDNCVDLLLPSGLLWATCNLGASSPYEYGNYYQWGSLVPYENKDQFYEDVDDVGLDDAHDIANKLLGGKWTMPRGYDFDELWYHTDSYWVKGENGIEGRVFVSKKDESRSIFLPACGQYYFNRLTGINEEGYYWSRSRYGFVDWKWSMRFNKNNIYSQYGTERRNGLCIRPVRKK